MSLVIHFLLLFLAVAVIFSLLHLFQFSIAWILFSWGGGGCMFFHIPNVIVREGLFFINLITKDFIILFCWLNVILSVMNVKKITAITIFPLVISIDSIISRENIQTFFCVKFRVWP